MLPMDSKMKTVLGLAVAVLVIAVIVWAVQKNQSDEGNNQNGSPTTSATPEGTDETPTQGSTGTVKKLTYDEALRIYGTAGNNYRFQFSTNCLATPGRLAVSAGTKFMIDNRDTVAHKFTLGKQTFNVSKNGFVIVTTSEKGTLPLVCDGNTRAEVLVQ